MRITRFPLALAACVTAACATHPDDNIDSQESELRNCLPSDPDCTFIPPSSCANATGSISVSPTTITQGQSVTVSWHTTVPRGCIPTISVAGQRVSASGSATFTPKSNWNYLLLVNGNQVARADVQVTLPPSIYINTSTVYDRDLFMQAVGIPGEHVGLGPDVDLDLTGYQDIPVAAGVTITGEMSILSQVQLITVPSRTFNLPMVPARNARSLGPRLYTTSRPSSLLAADCRYSAALSDNIHITNVRIQGPDMDTMDGDDKLEHGINIDSCVDMELGNVELSGWSGAAVYILDDGGRYNSADHSVHIHDSYIHNNQHSGKGGYGVDHQSGAWSLIEHNVFDDNRHSLTSSGSPGNGYTANENLVLAGGGHHDTWWSTYIQVFDVHGDANCPDVWPFNHTWDCGNAGDKFVFSNNAFQYSHFNAIKIRGNPRVQDFFYGNVFVQGNEDDAIGETQGKNNMSFGSNTYGVNTFGEYGVCDFDGDGKDDLFLATGASLWFKSAGKMQWTYLSNSTERLADVRLGDFDGDRRCDVLRINHRTNQWETASGGSGPWTAIPGYTADIKMDQLAVGDFDGDKVMDVFRRDGGGQWWAISPNRWDWTALQSSSAPLDHLRFGDFDGDGVTDVLGSNGGQWSISWSARSTWQATGAGLNDDLSQVFIGNVDGAPGDDVVRYVPTSPGDGHWDLSSGARTGWSQLVSSSWPINPNAGADLQETQPGLHARTFLGRFSGGTTADLLSVDGYRRGQLSTVANRPFGPWGFYQY